jgi:STE24 endopeptidase
VHRVLIVPLLLAAVLAIASPVGAAEASDYFTPAEIDASAAYRGRAYALTLGASALGIIVLIAIGAGRGSRRLSRWSARAFRGRRTRALALIAVVSVAPALAALPLQLGAHRHARAFGLATNSGGAFVRDVAVALAIQTVIFAVLALVLLALARRLPMAWPVVAAPAAAALTIGLVLVFPLIVEPMFNTFTPVDQRTRARVIRLADAMDVKVGDVLVTDASRRTTSLNAYVSGLGATKRVVLYDTLLEKTPPREIDVVVAHELAHQAHNDVMKGTLLGAAGTAGAVLVLWLLVSWARFRAWIGAEAPSDPAVIPFLALFIALATLVTTPAVAAYSRSIEGAADRKALAVTGDPDAMIGLHVRLARENLSDLDPNPLIEWALFSHPSTLDRIQMAERAR